MVGIRPMKLHEQMISVEDSEYTYEYSNYYKILPQINDWAKDTAYKNGTKVPSYFV